MFNSCISQSLDIWLSLKKDIQSETLDIHSILNVRFNFKEPVVLWKNVFNNSVVERFFKICILLKELFSWWNNLAT